MPGNKPNPSEEGKNLVGRPPPRLEEINHPTRMPDSQLKKPLHEAGANQALQLFSVRDLYRLSLIFSQIRQLNLPVSLHLSETYGSYVPSRSCTSIDHFIFIIALPSLSLSRISFSVPPWAVIKIVFWHYLIFIRVFKVTLVYLILHYFVFWRFILKRLFQ